MSERIYPFSSGSQHADWECSNCDHCRKTWCEATRTFHCDIQEALLIAYWHDGTVSPEISQRMGYTSNRGAYNWRCPEFQPVEQKETANAD